MKRTLLVCLCGAGAMIIGCQNNNSDHTAHSHAMHANMMAATATATLAPSKAATTQPVDKNVTGTVTFTQAGDKVHVTAHITGLAPNTTHGFHIHEKGDLSAPDLSSAGGHFNPGQHQHGAPSKESHGGDMGNVKADATGMAMVDMDIEGVSIGTGQPNDIVGKSVIVHGKEDDLKTQPSGNAGSRVAGGVIQLKQP
jgi:Cu-Zn family superoxide dismutase